MTELKRQKKLKNCAKWIYPLGMVALLLAVLLFIELKHPCFFFQDDNRDYYFPYIVHNYRSLLNGEIAFYNFYQSLGMPSFCVGQSTVFYPLADITTFLSKVFLGHYNGTIDILVIGHLLIGSLGAYALIANLTHSKKAAVFAGITWPLSSFVMYASNSWMIVSSVAAYMPWMIHFSILSYQKPDFKNRTFAVLSRILLFYSGHIQFFVYAVIFEFITVVLFIVSHEKKERKLFIYIVRYAVEYIAVFCIAAPLLFPMWHNTTISFQRSDSLTFKEFTELSYDFKEMMLGWVYPFLQVDGSYQVPWRNAVNLGHMGYITLVLLIIAIVSGFVWRQNKPKARLIVFIIPGVFAMLWASSIIIQSLIYSIPLLNRFRWPFKLTLYMDFFFIMAAAVALREILYRIKTKSRAKEMILGALIAMQIVNFLVLYTVMPYKDFGEHHADSVPLEDDLTEIVTDGRLISMDFDTWKQTMYTDYPYYTVPTMGFNYGMLLEVDCFGGYEQLMPETNHLATLRINHPGYYFTDEGIPVEYFRKAGVKWYLLPTEDKNNAGEILLSYGMEVKYSDDMRTLYYDKNATEMVFLKDGGAVFSNNIVRTTNTVSVNVNLESDTTVIFNYLYNPFFIGYVDGKRAGVEKSEDLYMGVKVTEGEHTVMIRYANPYFKAGIYVLCGFICIYICCIAVKKKKQHSKKN